MGDPKKGAKQVKAEIDLLETRLTELKKTLEEKIPEPTPPGFKEEFDKACDEVEAVATRALGLVKQLDQCVDQYLRIAG